jgi:AraC-like DNA-binding protein
MDDSDIILNNKQLKEALANCKIEVLPVYKTAPVFEQRESGTVHSAYAEETALYNCVKRGDAEGLIAAAKRYLSHGLVVGRLSADGLRQMRYLGVVSITLATRYAIEGGLEERTAFNMSDECIQALDKCDNPDEMVSIVSRKIYSLTLNVAKSKTSANYPQTIKNCLRYIDKNLHGKLTVAEIAKECGLSADYLSVLFKKNVGMNLSEYIMEQKLSAAKSLIDTKYPYGELAYLLGFCSETHFITAFKKRFGETPRQYSQKLNY